MKNIFILRPLKNFHQKKLENIKDIYVSAYVEKKPLLMVAILEEE